MIKTEHEITCVCVTKDRPKLLRGSIQSYINQTYTNKNLLIVSQSTIEINKMIKRQIADARRTDIRLIEVSRDLSLGEMRTCGVYEASGDIVCQWDDDDFYHPKRISTQYAALIREKAILSAYGSHLHFYKNSKEVYYVDWATEPGEDWQRCLSGTMMFFKKINNQYLGIVDNFPALQKEEDLGFIQKSFLEYPYAIVPQGYQYVYVYHGDNTCSEEHHQGFVESKYVYTKEEMCALSAHISQSCKNISHSPIRIMGSNGLAFILS
jgi:glycosyltransferase involved in cell wall biosynthesis